MQINWSTTLKNGESLSQSQKFEYDVDEVENHIINLYPEIRDQLLEGFGGAITDSSGYVYSLMNKEQKKALMETYFSPQGMNYQMVRIPIDSCDFSLDMYEAMSDPEDINLTHFSFERTEKYILPMLEDAQKVAGIPLKLMLSPWSPPAFMKTNAQRTHGGKLKKEYYPFWAEYLCRYILEFQKRGYFVQRISLQNEPKAVQQWDSCVYTAEEEKNFLQNYMFPCMQKHHLSDIEIFIWDHNKERLYERTHDILDNTTKDMIAGAAFHWYSGDHFDTLNLVHRFYPQLKLIVSESCIEYSKFDADDEVRNAGRLSHEIIGDLNHGMCAFYDWNILLDETGGPNHVGNLCHAPFLYHRSEKNLIPQLTQKYFYHFSHFIKSGAVRIATSQYTDQLDVTAFLNPDNSIVVVILNRTENRLPVTLRLNHQIVIIDILPQSILTGQIVKE